MMQLVKMRFISLANLNPELVFSLPEADVYIAVIVLMDVKPYKYKYSFCAYIITTAWLLQYKRPCIRVIFNLTLSEITRNLTQRQLAT
jgi:hypothetical protein